MLASMSSVFGAEKKNLYTELKDKDLVPAEFSDLVNELETYTKAPNER